MRGTTTRMQGWNTRQSSCSVSVSVKSSTATRKSCFKAHCCLSPKLGRGTRVGVRYCPSLESNRKSGLSVISRNDRSTRVFQNTNHSFNGCGVRDKMQFYLDHVSEFQHRRPGRRYKIYRIGSHTTVSLTQDVLSLLASIAVDHDGEYLKDQWILESAISAPEKYLQVPQEIWPESNKCTNCDAPHSTVRTRSPDRRSCAAHRS